MERELLNEESIGTLGEEEYLEIVHADAMKQMKTKEKVKSFSEE